MAERVTYKILDGKIFGHYHNGTVADFGSADEPYKSVMAMRPNGEIMVCTMSDEHLAQLREKLAARL